MLNVKDLHKGDKLIKISTSRAYFTAGDKPTEEYETTDDIYIYSVGTKYIHIGYQPDPLYTETWMISDVQPHNYLIKVEDIMHKEKAFKSMQDYEDYKEYQRLLYKMREVKIRDLSLAQLRQIAEICNCDSID